MGKQELAHQLMSQMNSVLVGKKEKVEFAVIALLAGGHLLVEDVPGVGKTTLANAIAKSIDLSFGRIQFTPDTLPSDITGVSVYNMKTGNFEYQAGVVMHHIVLADEINRTAPKTQSSLLEAMEEGQVTVDGVIHKIDPPFFVIATQNPIDFMGTYHLPEAQLDRFLMKITIGYPSNEDEEDMARRFLSNQRLETLQPIMTRDDLLAMQKEASAVKVHKDIITYIVSVIAQTRKEEALILGASPRATLAVIRASQAAAYLEGRNYCIPDDVIKVMPATLCHRFVLSMESKVNQVNTETILRNVMHKVTIPILRDFAKEA